MLSSFLLDATRSLRRHIGFTTLNVLGLAAGLTCVILIGLWVNDELSYDDFHPNAERTYRVLLTFDMPNLRATIGHGPAPLAPTLSDGYTQVEHAVRLDSRELTVETGSQQTVQDGILFADRDFFEVFGFSIQQGAARLGEPGTALLTPATVDRYVPGDTDPVGQMIRVDGTPVEVTGVVEPAPTRTHLNYQMIVSTSTLSIDASNWGRNPWSTYVTLRPGTSEADFEKTLEAISIQHLLADDAAERAAKTGELAQRFHLQPLTGIHLGIGAPALETGAGTGSVTYVSLFAALALFVLLLACINFINLSTARSAERANEVGVRKSMGAGREQLAVQFLSESTLIAGAGLVLAVGLSAALLPVFNTIAGKDIGLAVLLAPDLLAAYLGLGLVVGLAAGAYPAFVLSSYDPVETMRSRSTSTQGSPALRKSLVVFQFAISIALIVGTAVVHQQVSYLQSKGLGFTEDNVLIVDRVWGIDGPVKTRSDHRAFQRRLASFQKEVQTLPDIEQATAGFSVPGTMFINSMFALDEPNAERQNMNYSFVGTDYIETLDVEMAAGRDFSRDFPTDTAAVVLNAAAAKKYGLSPKRAVGRSISFRGMQMEIIGVTENFHYESLHNEIYPLLLFHESFRAPQYVVARVAEGREAAAVENVRDTWNQFADVPFRYSFLANDLAAQYEAEQRLERLFVVFAGLAVLIACLGLFGLAAYSARQRTKEIGIRKALGATVRSVIALVSKDFLLLVGIAFVVASPIAYLAMQQWLASFAYRIDLGLSIFAFAGVLAFVVAAATVSTQAWRAARVDPVSALRSE